jgi:hypothetical protein
MVKSIGSDGKREVYNILKETNTFSSTLKPIHLREELPVEVEWATPTIKCRIGNGTESINEITEYTWELCDRLTRLAVRVELPTINRLCYAHQS